MVSVGQDCDLSATQSLVSTLPPRVKSYMGMKLEEKRKLHECGKKFRLFISMIKKVLAINHSSLVLPKLKSHPNDRFKT